MMEALACHPLGKSSLGICGGARTLLTQMIDTIKVRMQLSRRARAPGVCSKHFTHPADRPCHEGKIN
jgi:hypothetical protein